MKLKELIDSVRNDVSQDAFDKDEILLLCDKAEELTKQPFNYNDLIGVKIKDFFCGGFFGSREFNMTGAVITDANSDYLTAKKIDGQVVQADISDCGIESVRDMVEEWTSGF